MQDVFEDNAGASLHFISEHISAHLPIDNNPQGTAASNGTGALQLVKLMNEIPRHCLLSDLEAINARYVRKLPNVRATRLCTRNTYRLAQVARLETNLGVVLCIC